MTLPDLDMTNPVLHEFSGHWPCCFNGCAEAGRYVHVARPCMELQSAMVLELADAALQVVEPISQRTGACQAFARCAVPQLGIGSFARLVTLPQQYGPDEDAELAVLLWQGEITKPASALKAVQRLRSLVAFFSKQGHHRCRPLAAVEGFGRCASCPARCTAYADRHNQRFAVALEQRALRCALGADIRKAGTGPGPCAWAHHAGCSGNGRGHEHQCQGFSQAYCVA